MSKKNKNKVKHDPTVSELSSLVETDAKKEPTQADMVSLVNEDAKLHETPVEPDEQFDDVIHTASDEQDFSNEESERLESEKSPIVAEEPPHVEARLSYEPTIQIPETPGVVPVEEIKQEVTPTVEPSMSPLKRSKLNLP